MRNGIKIKEALNSKQASYFQKTSRGHILMKGKIYFMQKLAQINYKVSEKMYGWRP